MSSRKPHIALASPVARLHLKVVPGASRERCAGMHGDRLKIRLRAPAVDGKANEALITFLARELDVPARTLTIVAGEKSREKTVAVAGMTAAALSAWQDRQQTRHQQPLGTGAQEAAAS
ncbi:MAG: DUF167 domain-containing protein [Candidatus Methylacidiphilales bacterium]|nr:DUF167 domain-containing protein [Candidatus Methylacidiphilales bacterium]